MLDTEKRLELSDFENLIDEVFSFSLDGVDETPQGQLVRAQALPCGNIPDDLRPPFSLRFKFPAGANIGQCTFLVEHEKLGKIPIFVVPVDENETGWYMEASFN